MKVLVLGLLLLTTTTVLVGVLSMRHWKAETKALSGELRGRRFSPLTSGLDDLPPPVARFLRVTLGEKPPLVLGARVVQEGEFRMSDAPDSWKPFSAEQVFRVSPPAFVWDARIRMMPGLPVLVRDSYHDGRGSMTAALLGLVPLANASGSSEIAVAALQRYLAEAVWFPTALLPREGVVWSPIDASSALATLTDSDSGISASLEFRFGVNGDVVGVYAPARNREVEGAFVPTPWEGVFRDHETRDGMRVPSFGEVAWILDGERRPYWRGRILDIVYEWDE